VYALLSDKTLITLKDLEIVNTHAFDFEVTAMGVSVANNTILVGDK
jgi:hypothetical protein